MKPHTTVASYRLAPTALGFACLLILAPGRAADDPVAAPSAPVIVSSDAVKPPSRHQKVVRGPVKLPAPQSKPQEEVRRLR